MAKSAPGEQFSRQDEVTLVMFASQSALVVSNARRLRDERRAKADLETLIDTSPVGVVVFDAQTGTPTSFNREARRLTASLGQPCGPLEMALLAPGVAGVAVLVNATSIRSDTGAVETYVVTLQDLTELEELSRLRAGFLAMASHELRPPLTSIKGSVATLRELVPSLSPVEALQFHRIIEQQADHMQGLRHRPAARGPH